MNKQSTVEYANKHANKSQTHTEMNKMNNQKHTKVYFGRPIEFMCKKLPKI